MKETQIKTDSSEMRSSARIDHSSPIQIKDIHSGNLHRAKMLNYSSEGLYFESDSMLRSGMQIYLGIKDSPFAASPDVIEYRRAEILWRKKLKQSYYSFGYGVKFHAAGKQRVVPTEKSTSKAELRRHPRKACRNTTRLCTDDAIFEGEIKNVSLSGIFISSDKALSVNQILTLSVPGKGGKALKMEGQVVWCNHEGCGIKIQRIEKILAPE
jgi:hypothetical protein